MKQKILGLLNKGGERSAAVKKNILGSFLIKGLSVIVSLLYVPITLNYLDPTRYGIWMTLTSVVAWIGIFDIGLGNGLRNKLAEALAHGEKDLAQKYVSTAYAMLTILVFTILVIFFIINQWMDWSVILNTAPEYSGELKIVASIVIGLFGFKFVLNLISTILTADQKPALGSVFELIGSSLGLLLIYILTLTEHTSLVSFGWVTMSAPVVVYLIGSIFFFRKKYNFLKPSVETVDFIHGKGLLTLGIQFFIIQIAVLVIFQTSNILISHFFSPAEVTPYNVTFKYFGILTMAWGILMVPIWSAFTQAKALNDITWIKKTLKNLNLLMVVTIGVILLMIYAAEIVISIWTGGVVIVSDEMIWIFGLYTMISIWNNIYAFLLNGTNKIKIQVYTAVLGAVLHLPISFILVKHYNFGSEGIVLSMAISLSFFAVAGPIQSYRLIKLWEKN